jgi:hypothetical protein
MIDACQIPEDVLSGLSTADLTDICLNYPLLGDVLAFDNPNLGLGNLFGNFNGIRELYRRKEVSENLLRHYDRHLHRLCLQNGTVLLTVLDELLLSRVEWNEESDREEFTELLRGLVAGYKARLDYESEFTDFLRINYFARAHIISKMNPQSLETLPENSVKALLYNGRITGETVLLFNQLSYKLIDK